MKFGLQIFSFSWPRGPMAIGPPLARTVQTADGVESLDRLGRDILPPVRGLAAADPRPVALPSG